VVTAPYPLLEPELQQDRLKIAEPEVAVGGTAYHPRQNGVGHTLLWPMPGLRFGRAQTYRPIRSFTSCTVEFATGVTASAPARRTPSR